MAGPATLRVHTGSSGSKFATRRVISSRFGVFKKSAARCSFSASAEGIRTNSAV
jgi:hypothetical protein